MTSGDPPDSIGNLAAEWAVKAALDDMSPSSRIALDSWLAADRRHRGAFMRACAWMRATEDAVIDDHAQNQKKSCPVAQPGQDRAVAHSPGIGPKRSGTDDGHVVPVAQQPDWGNDRRRPVARFLLGLTALAACLIGAVAVVSMVSSYSAVQAPADEMVTLKDGSVVALHNGAKITVMLSSDIRRIVLLNGEATFKVAKDKARPFVVQAGDVSAQATGTVYSVSRVGRTGGTVKVSEGSVLVWPRDERDQAVLLHAGGHLTLDPGPVESRAAVQGAAPAPRLPPPELAQISLDDVTVKDAAARFNRVNSTKIVIAAPDLAEMRIVGLYRANDPEQFARSVTIAFGGVVENSRKNIVIKMK